jgi:hypothetical protein
LIVEKSCDKAPPKNILMKKFRSSAAFEEFPTVVASEAS